MMTYEQASLIIPREEASNFFERHGFRIAKANATAKDIADYFRQVVKKIGDVATKDLQSLAEASAKKLGGCACGGNCESCKSSGAKTERSSEKTESSVTTPKAFLKDNSGLLIVGAIVVALALILKK